MSTIECDFPIRKGRTTAIDAVFLRAKVATGNDCDTAIARAKHGAAGCGRVETSVFAVGVREEWGNAPIGFVDGCLCSAEVVEVGPRGPAHLGSDVNVLLDAAHCVENTNAKARGIEAIVEEVVSNVIAGSIYEASALRPAHGRVRIDERARADERGTGHVAIGGGLIRAFRRVDALAAIADLHGTARIATCTAMRVRAFRVRLATVHGIIIAVAEAGIA